MYHVYSEFSAMKRRRMVEAPLWIVVAWCWVLATTTAFHQVSHTTRIARPGSIHQQRYPNEMDVLARNHGGPIGKTSTTMTTTALYAAPAATAVAAASWLVSAALSPLGAVLVLAMIILIHESGHYLAARSFGMEVEEFAIGFGPRLAGFEAFGNEFNLRLIPLGGYVRFPDNFNQTEVEELQRAANEAAIERRTEQLQGNGRPSLGFRISNALTLGALERKNQQDKELEVERRLEAYNKLPWWGKLKAIQDKRNDEKALDVEKVEIPYDDNPNLLQNRPWPQRAVVISAGVIGGVKGLPQPVFEPGVKVSAIPERTAAAMGVLQPGDVILRANGIRLIQVESPSVMEAQKGMNDLISTIRATPDGGQVELSILRGQNDYAETVRIQPKRVLRAGEEVPSGAQTIGVMLTPNFVKTNMLKTGNLVEAARLACQYTYSVTADTAGGLVEVLKQFFTSRRSGGGGGSAQVSGPIGLIRTGSEVVATRDFQTVLLFAAAISINLGVINAFPLPVLDGGQLVFVLLEAVTRRKIDQQVQERIAGVATLLLLGLTIGATFGDITSILGL